MSEYKIIDATEISREKWWEFTDNTENCNIFSTPYMYDVWNLTPGYKPFAFFAMDDNEEINGILTGYLETVSKGILSKISTRAVLMQSPVALDDEALSSLLKHYLTFIKRKAVYTEIRNNYDTSIQRNIYESLGFIYEEHLNILIDLSQEETNLWNNIHPNRRKMINRAKKGGIIIKILSLEDLENAYLILKDLYNSKNLPLPPHNFFYYALNTNNNKAKMEIYGAYINNVLIAIQFILKYKETVTALYTASKKEYYKMRHNDILPWVIFVRSKQEGYKVFDFGGAGKPNVPYGVRDYKMSFGGKIVNYGRYYFYHSKPLFKIAETGFKSLQKINSIKSSIQNLIHLNS